MHKNQKTDLFSPEIHGIKNIEEMKYKKLFISYQYDFVVLPRYCDSPPKCR